MPQNMAVAVKDLKLDLENFRTVPQNDEIKAIEAIILIKPDWFWALADSLIDTGYLPTENILVLMSGQDYIVKEGNRRVAALKIIHGLVSIGGITMPTAIRAKIANISNAWKTANAQVPCAVYPAADSALVDKIVTLTHGKAELAGRAHWPAVARARHNRAVNEASEPALDLLEAYLNTNKKIPPETAEEWAGDYPITVLEEALSKLVPRMGVGSAADLAKNYPAVAYCDELNVVIYDIGKGLLQFKTIRPKSQDFAIQYGFPPAIAASAGPATTSMAATSTSSPTTTTQSSATSTTSAATPAPSTTTSTQAVKKRAAVAINDPRSVERKLKALKIMGKHRDKVVTLKNEVLRLDLTVNPIAFCFLLRSMFELSAKAYCDDQAGTSGAPLYKKADGSDRILVEVLRDVTKHLTTDKNDPNKKDNGMVKQLQGPMTDLAKQDGLLSVTSMNALVHNPSFSLSASDICTVFSNIFPLLEAMNK